MRKLTQNLSIQVFIIAFAGMLLSQPAESGNPFEGFLKNIQKSIGKSQSSDNQEEFSGQTQVEVGSWQGNVTQPGYGAYPVTATLNNLSIGNKAGTFMFPTLGCSGSLMLLEIQGGVFIFQGNLEHGKDRCLDGVQVKMKQIRPGQQFWEWYYPNGKRASYAVLGKGVTQATQRTGVVVRKAKLRSGPGTYNRVMAFVPRGTVVNLTAKRGNWYRVLASIRGRSTAGWIHSSVISAYTSRSAHLTSGHAQPVGVQGYARSQASEQNQTNIDYAGYSKGFMPVKQMLIAGKLDDIAKFYAAQEEEKKKDTENELELVKKIGFLRWLERGTLAIDQGEFDVAVNDFSSAEILIKEKGKESKAGGFFGKVFATTAEVITGNEEITEYEGAGWEKILMLNYKSIAYLLLGDRRAYNVTRRAIDWQNIEKKAFDQKLQDEKEKLSEETEGQDTENEETNNAETSKQSIKSGLAKAFAPMDAKASTVPSAYVNPFGFYVAGMIQEFESYSDRSLRDNARISYKKALELNPDSKILKKAVKDLKKPVAPSGTRLVHIIIADGFVPEKKVLTYNVRVGNGIVPLKLPIYIPVSSKVHRIEVQTASGKRMATLSPVADIEAICLRQQKDMQPILTMRALAAFLVASVVESTAQKSEGIAGALFKVVSSVRKKASAPDTRSWMSLPSTIQAARLHLRKGVSKLKIVTFNKKGKKLATKLVRIDKNKHNIIYARSIDKILYAQSAKKLWLAGL